MARASKGKLRYLRNYYMTLNPTIYIDRKGRQCIAYRGKSFVNVQLEGPTGPNISPLEQPHMFEIAFHWLNQ